MRHIITSLVNVAFSGHYNVVVQFAALSTLIAGGALAGILSVLAVPVLFAAGILFVSAVVIALPVVVSWAIWTDARRTTARLQREATARLQERMERTIRAEVTRLEQVNNASRIADVFSARTVDAGEPTLAVAACSPVDVSEVEPIALVPVKIRKPSKSKARKPDPVINAYETMDTAELATWLRANGHKTARKNWSREKLLTLARSVGK